MIISKKMTEQFTNPLNIIFGKKKLSCQQMRQMYDIVTGETYTGDMTFSVKRDPWYLMKWISAEWFSTEAELLGLQKIDDGVFRQGFIFEEDGDYTILAEFSEGEHTHIMNFPLRVGVPPLIGSTAYIVGIVIVVLLVLSMVKRKRLQLERIRRHHSENIDQRTTDNG